MLESNQAISCVIVVSNCDCQPIAARFVEVPAAVAIVPGESHNMFSLSHEIVRDQYIAPIRVGIQKPWPSVNGLRILHGPWSPKKQWHMNLRLELSELSDSRRSFLTPLPTITTEPQQFLLPSMPRRISRLAPSSSLSKE